MRRMNPPAIVVTQLRESARQAQARAAVLRRRSEEVLAEAERTLANTPGSGRYAELAREVAGLRRALETRATIEQAKGIVIAATGCDPDAAFDVLVRQSQHENRKLHAVAEDLVRTNVRTGLPPA
jgi:AmiR/NasT family two-component response regulator